MEGLVGRTKEVAELRRLQHDPPRFAIVRGRRRIGKSYLLSAALQGTRLVSYQADEQPLAGQLALLAAEAARLLPGEPRLAFDDWDAALRFFDTQAAIAPVTLLLDEFQFLCHSHKPLPSIVMRWWDRWQRERLPITLIIAGSALSFMQGLVAAQGAFFGRADWRPLIEPLSYREGAAFTAAGASAEQLVMRHGVLGGTPQYQAWAGARPLASVIKDVILAKGAPLYEEPLNLLRGEEDIRQPGTYFGILRAIAGGDTTATAIAGRAGTSLAQMSRMLDRLAELGYLFEVRPVGFAESHARAYWRIADPYFHFWFRYVFPNRSRLDRGLVDEVYGEIDRDLSNYLGGVLEGCCRVWAASFSPLAADIQEVGSWWSRSNDSEVDVVGIDRKQYRLLGSCKWSRSAGEDVLDHLYGQRAQLQARAARAQLAVFARGFHPKLRERAAAEGVWLVSVRDLFATP